MARRGERTSRIRPPPTSVSDDRSSSRPVSPVASRCTAAPRRCARPRPRSRRRTAGAAPSACRTVGLRATILVAHPERRRRRSRRPCGRKTAISTDRDRQRRDVCAAVHPFSEPKRVDRPAPVHDDGHRRHGPPELSPSRTWSTPERDIASLRDHPPPVSGVASPRNPRPLSSARQRYAPRSVALAGRAAAPRRSARARRPSTDRRRRDSRSSCRPRGRTAPRGRGSAPRPPPDPRRDRARTGRVGRSGIAGPRSAVSGSTASHTTAPPTGRPARARAGRTRARTSRSPRSVAYGRSSAMRRERGRSYSHPSVRIPPIEHERTERLNDERVGQTDGADAEERPSLPAGGRLASRGKPTSDVQSCHEEVVSLTRVLGGASRTAHKMSTKCCLR